MWCVIGALAALKQREATGNGCVVDTSLFESAVAWVQGPLNTFGVTGKLPQRHGAASATLAPYQTFETADRPICIAAGNDRLFVKLAQAMGCPEWATDPRFSDGRKRAANREALAAVMQPVLLAAPAATGWMSAMARVAGVPPVNDIADLAVTEQLQAMDMMRHCRAATCRWSGCPSRSTACVRTRLPTGQLWRAQHGNFRSSRMTQAALFERARSYQQELAAIRHYIHAHPELGLEEVRTADLVAKKLESGASKFTAVSV